MFAALRGHVTREEMMEFGRFMNSKFDEEKLNKLMDQMDLDKDGLISMEEFLGYFAKVKKRSRGNSLFHRGTLTPLC